MLCNPYYLLQAELLLSRNNTGYSIIPNGDDCFLVFDAHSKNGICHEVCINPKAPSCNPCRTYPHFKLVCRHQLL